jgi:hypothetical protein
MTAADSRPSAAARVTQIVVIAGVLILLGLNLPGHLSYDSVAQLREGRFGERFTWGPALYAWILGVGDRIFPGTALYVTASAVLLGATLLLLLRLRPRTSWAAVPVAAAIMLSPQVMIYPGIVWKDVLFANCALAGFVLVAYAASHWPQRGRRLGALALAALLFAVGALVRQNGALVIPVAALALAWTARSGGWLRAGAWGLAGLVLTFALIKGIGMAVEPPTDGPDISINRGVRIIEHYDIIGIAARDRSLPLDTFAKVDPLYAAIVREAASGHYSAERVDTLGAVVDKLWLVPDAVAAEQWRRAIQYDPTAYLYHRGSVYRWLMAPPDPARCLPVHVGVMAPAPLLADLKMAEEVEARDLVLNAYVERLQKTPIFVHANYAALAALLLVGLLLRRDATDWALAAMLASALAFTASFFVISIACDYRYLYFLDLTVMAALLYLAADPPRLRGAGTFRRRGSGPPIPGRVRDAASEQR